MESGNATIIMGPRAGERVRVDIERGRLVDGTPGAWHAFKGEQRLHGEFPSMEAATAACRKSAVSGPGSVRRVRS